MYNVCEEEFSKLLQEPDLAAVAARVNLEHPSGQASDSSSDSSSSSSSSESDAESSSSDSGQESLSAKKKKRCDSHKL